MDAFRKLTVRPSANGVVRLLLAWTVAMGTTLAGTAWAGPMDLYYAATDTTHHDWDELALAPNPPRSSRSRSGRGSRPRPPCWPCGICSPGVACI